MKILVIVAGLIAGFLWPIVGSFYFLLCGNVGCENIRYLVLNFPMVICILFLSVQPFREYLKSKIEEEKFPFISNFIISAGLMSLWVLIGEIIIFLKKYFQLSCTGT